MTKEKFLTVRWNNILTLTLGIPTLVYVLMRFFECFLVHKGWLDRACTDWCGLLNWN